MKEHLEEQVERLKQQLEDAQMELTVKEKELKKIQYTQLMMDTQSNVIQNLNASQRGS